MAITSALLSRVQFEKSTEAKRTKCQTLSRDQTSALWPSWQRPMGSWEQQHSPGWESLKGRKATAWPGMLS